MRLRPLQPCARRCSPLARRGRGRRRCSAPSRPPTPTRRRPAPKPQARPPSSGAEPRRDRHRVRDAQLRRPADGLQPAQRHDHVAAERRAGDQARQDAVQGRRPAGDPDERHDAGLPRPDAGATARARTSSQLNRNLVRARLQPRRDRGRRRVAGGHDGRRRSASGVARRAETGTLALGQVVFLPGDQLVSTVDATARWRRRQRGHRRPFGRQRQRPGADGRARIREPGAPGRPARRQADRAQAARAPPEPEADRDASGADRAAEGGDRRAAVAPGQPGREQPEHGQQPPQGHQRGNTPKRARGARRPASGSSPTPILQTTSTQLVVTVDLDATKQSEAKVGRPVTVELPNGDTVNGKITAVSPVAQSSNGNSGNHRQQRAPAGDREAAATARAAPARPIPVTITLSATTPARGSTRRRSASTSRRRSRNNVLSVPVTALLATGGGLRGAGGGRAAHADPGHDRAVRGRLRRDLRSGHLPGPAGHRLPGMTAIELEVVARSTRAGSPRCAASASRCRTATGRRGGTVGLGQDDDADDHGHARAADRAAVRVAGHDVGSASDAQLAGCAPTESGSCSRASTSRRR